MGEVVQLFPARATTLDFRAIARDPDGAIQLSSYLEWAANAIDSALNFAPISSVRLSRSEQAKLRAAQSLLETVAAKAEPTQLEDIA